MKVFKKIVSIGLIFAISICCVIPVSAAKTLSVTRCKQEKSQWCWAASAQVVSKYYKYNLSQSNIVMSVLGHTNNVGASLNQTRKAFQFGMAQKYKAYASYTALKLSDMKTMINTNKLPGVRMGWNSGGGHILICYGYTGSNNSTIQLLDPWMSLSTGRASYSYSSLVNGTTILTGTGKFNEGIRY